MTHQFVRDKLYRIKGFMHPTDAYAFVNLLDDQAQRGVEGHVGEIGVFYGRSFALLGRAARKTGDQAVGIDLFDIDGQRASVERTLTSEGLGETCTLLAKPSEQIDPNNLVARFGRSRFFHIDGGHERHHLLADVALAEAILAKDAIVVFDDFMNPQYPDLSAAIIDTLREKADVFGCFGITRAKLYVCRRGMEDLYASVLAQGPNPPGSNLDRFEFLGRPLTFLNQRIKERAIYQALAGIGMGSVAEKIVRSREATFRRE